LLRNIAEIKGPYKKGNHPHPYTYTTIDIHEDPRRSYCAILQTHNGGFTCIDSRPITEPGKPEYQVGLKLPRGLSDGDFKPKIHITGTTYISPDSSVRPGALNQLF
jgi:hypothetical protein